MTHPRVRQEKPRAWRICGLRRTIDIDMIYVTGFGYPAYRGGPMWYMDAAGLDNV